MPLSTLDRKRYVLPVAEFKAFIAAQLNVNANDIDEISVTPSGDYWQVVMKEIQI